MVKELKQLSTIAKTQPHAAFAAYTHGLKNKWSYLSRIMPDIGPRLQALEDILRSDLIPTSQEAHHQMAWKETCWHCQPGLVDWE